MPVEPAQSGALSGTTRIGELAVVPRQVVQPADGWNLADGRVEPVVIVVMQPGREGGSAG